MLSYCLPRVGAFPGVGWRQTGCGWRDNPGFISLKAKWKLMLARTLMETEQDRVQTAKQQLALAVGLRSKLSSLLWFPRTLSLNTNTPREELILFHPMLSDSSVNSANSTQHSRCPGHKGRSHPTALPFLTPHLREVTMSPFLPRRTALM